MSDDVQRFSDLLFPVAARGLQRGFQLSYEEYGLLSIPALENAGLFGASLPGGRDLLHAAVNPSCDFWPQRA